MKGSDCLTGSAMPLTHMLARTCLERAHAPIPADVLTIARHSLLDWLGVLAAGWDDPSVGMLEQDVLEDEATPRATLLGSGARTSVGGAALVNGMASHVLDFDDVHLRSRVHPSVPLWPAIIAIAEREHLNGAQVLAAFVAGVEMQSRIAIVMGEEHYKRGWHNTATFGMFGATLAVAALHGLDTERTQHALGICATQAAGMRAAFGTMCKPLHAGRAAAVAIQSVSLARRGFTSQTDMLEREGGFIELYASARTPDAIIDALADAPDYQVRTILFKYNASCYGTQGSIEACKLLRHHVAAHLDDIESINIRVEPQYLSVCCIAAPVTGLEAKFSIAQMAALTLAGWSTVDARSYTAIALDDPTISALRAKVRIAPNPRQPRASADVAVMLRNGSRFEQHYDASCPETDLTRQESQLRAKAASLMGERFDPVGVDALINDVLAFDAGTDVAAFVSRFAAALSR